MAQSEGFKHITVTPAEEDDVVIVAGVAAREEGPVTESPQPEPNPVPDSAPDQEPEPGSEPEPAHEPDPEPNPEPDPEPAARRAARKAPAKEPYRETTLEDLRPEPMPFAQKVVIIAAVLCIIGAVVYYFAFMR